MNGDNPVKYIEQLTWLRGIAAFFVIVSHSLRANEEAYVAGDEAVTGSILSTLDLGGFGVLLFFVLSGCTLYVSNASKMNMAKVPDFYIKRVFRIWPAFLMSLLIYILFRPVFIEFYPAVSGNWIEKQFLADFTFDGLMAYVFLVFNITGPWGIFNNAYWSLPVEFQYYLIFPLLIFLTRVSGVVGPIAVGLLLYLVPKTGMLDVVNNKVFYLAFTFCSGVVIGWIYTNSDRRFTAGRSMLILLGIVLFTSAVKNGLIPVPDLPVIAEYHNWYGVMAILSVYVVLMTRFDFHNTVERMLKYYGTISYSTYLYHNIFVAVSVLLLYEMGVHDATARLWFTFIFTFFMTLVAAGLSFSFIEKPFITIGRNIVSYVSALRAPTAR